MVKKKKIAKISFKKGTEARELRSTIAEAIKKMPKAKEKIEMRKD